MKKVPEQTGRGAAKLASPAAARELAGKARGLQQTDSCDRVTRIDRRAGSAERILATVSRELTAEIGGGMLFQRTDGGLFEPAVLNSPKLSPAVRVMQPQADTVICRRHGGQMPLSGAAI